MGRASKTQAQSNRAQVVEAASRLMRERGLNGVGIAEVMAEAGLTHGGFYRQFASREALAGEACAHAVKCGVESWKAKVAAAAPGRKALAIVADYLSKAGVDNRCALPTLAADAAREPLDSPARAAFTQGVRDFAAVLGEACDDERRGFGLLCVLVGAAALSRAVDDPELARALAEAATAIAGSQPREG